MARVKSFKAAYGTSAEVEGVWHKFHSEIEIELTEGDNVGDIKEKAWNTVKYEVENQIKKELG